MVAADVFRAYLKNARTPSRKGTLAMNRPGRLCRTILLAALLGFAFQTPVLAEIAASPALSGKITSQQEGAMEGVLVGAKKIGSTIGTWVVSNAQGQYTFPRERME